MRVTRSAFEDLTNRQDWRVNERTQTGVASRAYIPGRTRRTKGYLPHSTVIISPQCGRYPVKTGQKSVEPSFDHCDIRRVICSLARQFCQSQRPVGRKGKAHDWPSVNVSLE